MMRGCRSGSQSKATRAAWPSRPCWAARRGSCSAACWPRNARDPRDAMNLVNAAVPLAHARQAGRGAGAARPRRGRRPRSAARPRLANPLGLSGRGVLENNRGYALLKLGRPAEADRAAAPRDRRRADGRWPRHTRTSRSALICSGGSADEAVKLIRQSYARRPLELPARRASSCPGGLVELPESPWAKDVYDLDAGQPDAAAAVQVALDPGAELERRRADGRDHRGEQRALAAR